MTGGEGTKTWPTLYKKTSTGAIQYWSIKALAVCDCQLDLRDPEKPRSIPDDDPNSGCHSDADDTERAGEIVTEFGQVGTDSPQKTSDLITKGKNAGKKNATTPLQQAELEAQAKWEKQKKKGYVETLEAAQAGETDKIIEGGIVPMLAHKFTEHGYKIKFPCYAQPKLDGIRCIAIVEDGKCTLWSRTRKLITGVPHIQRKLEKLFRQVNLVLDGELYNHELKSDFEKIVSMVRQEEPAEGHEIVQYHIYDLVAEDKQFSERAFILQNLNLNEPELNPVTTKYFENEDALMQFFDECRALGFEGAMARNSDGMYVNKRSYDLQKIKEFEDGEFKIIGVEEGRGKLQGHAASFICQTVEGQTFNAKLKGELSTLKNYFNIPQLWQGKILTVKYQGWTNKNGVPRFPVGVAVRDYE